MFVNNDTNASVEWNLFAKHFYTIQYNPYGDEERKLSGAKQWEKNPNFH